MGLFAIPPNVAGQQVKRCRVYLNASQSVLNTTDTRINFTTVLDDPLGWWDSTNKRIKPNVAGIGLVILNAEWAPQVTVAGERAFEIWDAGGGFPIANVRGGVQNNSRIAYNLSTLYSFDGASTAVMGNAYQGSGGALNIQANGIATMLQLVMFPGIQ